MWFLWTQQYVLDQPHQTSTSIDTSLQLPIPFQIQSGVHWKIYKLWPKHQLATLVWHLSYMLETSWMSSEMNLSRKGKTQAKGWAETSMGTNLQRGNCSKREWPQNSIQDPWHSSPWILPHSLLPVTMPTFKFKLKLFQWRTCFLVIQYGCSYQSQAP